MSFTSMTRDVPDTRRRVWRRLVLLTLLALWAITAWWQTNKTLPPGLHVDSAWYALNPANVSFIADITSADAYGRPVVSQAVFDEVLQVIRSARHFVVLDYFLFNARRDDSGPIAPARRQISVELRDALIEQRREHPDLQVLFITDPINETYGSNPSADLQRLRSAGVAVAVTDLDRLRDSNFIYSSLWRLLIAWWSGGSRGFGSAAGTGSGDWLPNPIDESSAPGTLLAWLRLLNFKANQRKVVLADDGRGNLVAIVGSANPHDASSAHSNVAMKVFGPGMLPLLQSELAIARFSGWQGEIEAAVNSTEPSLPAGSGAGRLKVLTEGAIRTELLERLQACVAGDNIDIAMFYIADRGVIEALLDAGRRGVNVRLILDPNKDAFGHAKSGIPNQPAASELVAASDDKVHVRWYRTHGEQFHTKFAAIYGPKGLWLTVGSANLTRRNLGDYDLEANVGVEVELRSALAQQAIAYFDTLWSNRASLGIEYTADFGYYADPSQLHYWLYRVMEGTGLSTF